MYYDTLIAGFGGQGVLFIGNLLAHAAMVEGYHVTFMPSYGVEMRGGNANCNVIVSSEEIGSPVIDNPCSAIFLNPLSLERFQDIISPKGLLLFNTSLIDPSLVSRKDVIMVPVPANELASKLGNIQMASLVALGVFIEWTQILKKEYLEEAMEEMIPPKLHERYMDLNLSALREGYEFARNVRSSIP
jgi:2-oxoglutarate ferredoxin oxidoreductase subunit gamma